MLLVTAIINRPSGWKPADPVVTGMEAMPEKNRHMFCKQSSMNPSILPVPSFVRPRACSAPTLQEGGLRRLDWAADVMFRANISAIILL